MIRMLGKLIVYVFMVISICFGFVIGLGSFDSFRVLGLFDVFDNKVCIIVFFF